MFLLLLCQSDWDFIRNLFFRFPYLISFVKIDAFFGSHRQQSQLKVVNWKYEVGNVRHRNIDHNIVFYVVKCIVM